MSKHSKKSRTSFWKDGLSINEARFSVLVLMALVGFGYALFSHYRTGDITDNLLDLLNVLIFSIVGINVTNHVTGVFRDKREDTTSPNYNEGANQDRYYNYDQSSKEVR